MTQDTIIFNSVKTSHGTEINFGPLGIRGKVGVDEFGGVINAVDIDWNGAQLNLPDALGGGAETITTTGQLFRRL